jgi:23S rRNA pseudoU1915 N3-methylase RlmH
MELTQFVPQNTGYKVVISSSGEPITDSKLKAILSKPKVSFYIGDSKGIPDEIIDQADEILSISALKISHQLEAANLTAAIENCLINSNVLV